MHMLFAVTFNGSFSMLRSRNHNIFCSSAAIPAKVLTQKRVCWHDLSLQTFPSRTHSGDHSVSHDSIEHLAALIGTNKMSQSARQDTQGCLLDGFPFKQQFLRPEKLLCDWPDGLDSSDAALVHDLDHKTGWRHNQPPLHLQCITNKISISMYEYPIILSVKIARLNARGALISMLCNRQAGQ